MKQILCILFLLTCANSFAQQNKLFRKQLLKPLGFYLDSWPSSAKNGDTLRFYRGKKPSEMNFKRNQKILLKGFGFTYSGERFVEFKEKGKWHLVSNNGQILILDFDKSRVELLLISNKNDFLEFTVKNHSAK